MSPPVQPHPRAPSAPRRARGPGPGEPRSRPGAAVSPAAPSTGPAGRAAVGWARALRRSAAPTARALRGWAALCWTALCWAPEAEAGPYKAIAAAEARGKISVLEHHLLGTRAWAREAAAAALSRLPPQPALVPALLDCVSREAERGYVRAACAGALGSWRVPELAPAAAAALPQLDAEARYWMAEALHRLGGAAATAELRGLHDDPDLYVARAAREWAQ